MEPPKFCIRDYNISIVIFNHITCKLIKSMVCHMLWILTSEEFDELALEGITIPHGQWTLPFVFIPWTNRTIQ